MNEDAPVKEAGDIIRFEFQSSGHIERYERSACMSLVSREGGHVQPDARSIT